MTEVGPLVAAQRGTRTVCTAVNKQKPSSDAIESKLVDRFESWAGSLLLAQEQVGAGDRRVAEAVASSEAGRAQSNRP